MPPIISFFSNFILGTTPVSGDRPKVSGDEDDEENNKTAGQDGAAGAAAADPTLPSNNNDHSRPPPPVPPLPRRALMRAPSASRARSLSRVYNQVPRDRPNFRRAQQDVIEYYAHLAMIETDVGRVLEEECHLRDAMKGCDVRRYGRLFSRLQITSLCVSIGCLSTEADHEEGVDEEEPYGVRMMPPHLWKELREQLIVVKSYMLRKDANMFVPIDRTGYEDEEIPRQNDELDGVLEKHEMFQDSYKEVLLLLEVTEILTRLCDQIKKIDLGADNAVKQVESAVDAYESSLQSTFIPEGIPDGANIGEKAKTSIPSELSKFLLHELYKKKPEDAVPSLLRDAVTIMCDDDSVFSLSQLKHKVSRDFHEALACVNEYRTKPSTHFHLLKLPDEILADEMVRKHSAGTQARGNGVWRSDGANFDRRRRRCIELRCRRRSFVATGRP